MSEASKRLYVYEQVLSRADYKTLSGRKIVTDKQWQNFCESMTTALEIAADDVLKSSRRTAN